MIARKIHSLLLATLFAFTALINVSAANINQLYADSIQADKDYFAIEINGVVCGYMEAGSPRLSKTEEIFSSRI